MIPTQRLSEADPEIFRLIRDETRRQAFAAIPAAYGGSREAEAAQSSEHASRGMQDQLVHLLAAPIASRLQPRGT